MQLLLCLTLSVSLLPLSIAQEKQHGFHLSKPEPLVPEGYSLDLSERRLVQLGDGQEPIWMSEWDKIQYKAAGVNFMDITDNEDLGLNLRSSGPPSGFPRPNASGEVKKIMTRLTTEEMKANLRKLTSFRTRYYRSSTGADSQKWLLGRIEALTDELVHPSIRSFVSISEFKHNWGQNSIIARINGTNSSNTEVVILGAHQDSTNLFPFLAAPGADDDGSGTVTILEAYSALIAGGFRPQRSVEFHWYSAEEGGLLGSQAVAKEYQRLNVNVYAMMQMDMTAWLQKGTKEVVGIVTDFVDPALTEFNRQLVEAYLDIGYVNTKCGYACSDHASWQKGGYPAAFAIESAFEDTNKHIHSTNDRIDISSEFSFDHMLQFSKLAVAFAMHLGGI